MYMVLYYCKDYLQEQKQKVAKCVKAGYVASY